MKRSKEGMTRGDEAATWNFWAMRGYTDKPANGEKEAEMALKIFNGQTEEDSFSRLAGNHNREA